MPLFLRTGALALALSSPASQLNGTMNAGLPPVRFQNNAVAIVVFTDRIGIDAECGVAPPPYTVIACTKAIGDTPVVFMPNACPAGATEYFARIMCHEMGHVQGWSGEHEE